MSIGAVIVAIAVVAYLEYKIEKIESRVEELETKLEEIESLSS
jgi:hypothetical protein